MAITDPSVTKDIDIYTKLTTLIQTLNTAGGVVTTDKADDVVQETISDVSINQLADVTIPEGCDCGLVLSVQEDGTVGVTDPSLTSVTGTEDNPIIMSELEPGFYKCFGWGKLTPTSSINNESNGGLAIVFSKDGGGKGIITAWDSKMATIIINTDGTYVYDEFATHKYLSEAISDVVTSTGLIDILSDYVTSASLTSTLGDYVTSTNLTSTLGDYVTSTNLTSTLGDYVTDSELTTVLEDYAESADLSIVATSGSYADLTNVPSTFTPSEHNHDSLYLNKENTAEYTPTADYHPVTKKCLDEAVNQLSILIRDLTLSVQSLASHANLHGTYESTKYSKTFDYYYAGSDPGSNTITHTLGGTESTDNCVEWQQTFFDYLLSNVRSNTTINGLVTSTSLQALIDDAHSYQVDISYGLNAVHSLRTLNNEVHINYNVIGTDKKTSIYNCILYLNESNVTVCDITYAKF